MMALGTGTWLGEAVAHDAVGSDFRCCSSKTSASPSGGMGKLFSRLPGFKCSQLSYAG